MQRLLPIMLLIPKTILGWVLERQRGPWELSAFISSRLQDVMSTLTQGDLQLALDRSLAARQKADETKENSLLGLTWDAAISSHPSFRQQIMT